MVVFSESSRYGLPVLINRSPVTQNSPVSYLAAFMPKPKVYLRENSLLARLAASKLKSARVAMVIRRTIHLWGVSAVDFLKDEQWVCHELEHVSQYKRMGTLVFLWKYTSESIRKGYYNNSLEIAARSAERNRALLQQYAIQLPPAKPKNRSGNA
jgi:hypothetical protein